MEMNTLYIDLKDWIQNYHPELTTTKIEMIKSIMDELNINEEDKIVVTCDYNSFGQFQDYLIEKLKKYSV